MPSWLRASRIGATLVLSITVATPPATAGPVMVMEPATGTVFATEEPDQIWYPASLTKLMTAYLAFDAVKTGRMAWDTAVPLSEYARQQPATRIGLRLGIQLTVEQAVRGLILRSANDFAMGLAELIGGSEEAFAGLMNDTAKRLGMTRSRFKNPHGLPDPDQITTARDMAILTAALLRDFPDRAEVFATPIVRIHRQNFHSQNDLLRTFEGADGMKTGFTCGAGYNVVASATRNGRRLVAVVLGAVTRNERSERATQLLEAGFEHLTGRKPLTAVTLAALPMSPAEAPSVGDMSRLTMARQCGNRMSRRAVNRRMATSANKGAPAASASPASETNGALPAAHPLVKGAPRAVTPGPAPATNGVKPATE